MVELDPIPDPFSNAIVTLLLLTYFMQVSSWILRDLDLIGLRIWIFIPNNSRVQFLKNEKVERGYQGGRDHN